MLNFSGARAEWMAPLLFEVADAFAETGADTPGWDDPHADRDVAEEEYSRVLEPEKYRIVDARVEAWARALADHDVVCDDVESGSAHRWLDSGAEMAGDVRVRRFRPAKCEGVALLVAVREFEGSRFLDVGVATQTMAAAYVGGVPDCGCDACDEGSQELLALIDEFFLVAARGDVVHARNDRGRVSRHLSGWGGRGVCSESWLDAEVGAPEGVQRYEGQPWL